MEISKRFRRAAAALRENFQYRCGNQREEQLLISAKKEFPRKLLVGRSFCFFIELLTHQRYIAFESLEFFLPLASIHRFRQVEEQKEALLLNGAIFRYSELPAQLSFDRIRPVCQI